MDRDSEECPGDEALKTDQQSERGMVSIRVWSVFCRRKRDNGKFVDIVMCLV